MEAQNPTSNVHVDELRSLESIQALKLDSGLQVIQHLRNGTPLERIDWVDMVTVGTCSRSDRSS